MAAGRMLRACISESEQVANLMNDTVRLIFLFVLAHADVEGRYSANPRIVKGKVFPLLELSTETIMDALLDLDDHGLIYLYEAEEKVCLAFTGWARHQKVRKDRESPKYPPPTDVFPRVYAQHSPHHAHLTSRRVPGALLADADPKTNPSQDQAQDQDEGKDGTSVGFRRPTHDYEGLIAVYNQHRGDLPAASAVNQKRSDGLQALVAEHGFEEASNLLAAATQYVAGDEFWLERRYNLDNLLAERGRVLEKAEKFRSGGTPKGGRAKGEEKFAQYEEMGL